MSDISAWKSAERKAIHLNGTEFGIPNTIFGDKISIVAEVQVKFSTNAFDGTFLTYAVPQGHEMSPFSIIGRSTKQLLTLC